MSWIRYVCIWSAQLVLPMAIICLGGGKNRKQASSSCRLEEEGAFFSRRDGCILKGVAISCVMLCHLMGKFGGGVTLFTPLGGIGVSIFLILSAYGLNESYAQNGLAFFWRKRVLSVLLPYALVSSLAYWPFHSWSFKGFFLDVLCLKPKYVIGWYLNYLMAWYAVFYAAMRIPCLRRRRLAVFSIVSVLLFFVCSEVRAEQSLSFLAGILISEKKEAWKKYADGKAGLLLIGVGTCVLGVKQASIVREAPRLAYHIVQLMIKLPCGLGLCLTVPSLARKWDLTVFAWIGAISYELYLVHGIVLQSVRPSVLGECLFLLLSFSLAAALRLLLSKTKGIQRAWLGVP